jgi:hypothetical protein
MQPLPKIKVKIKENSFRARIAAFNLGNKRVAMVWGTTILLFNTTKQEFLADKQWVLHELKHVVQAHKIGKLRFLWRYFVLSFKYGYINHPYEVDARRHEQDESLLNRVEFV